MQECDREYLDKLTADYKATLARIEALKATCPREWTREGKVDIGLYLLVGVVAWFVC